MNIKVSCTVILQVGTSLDYSNKVHLLYLRRFSAMEATNPRDPVMVYKIPARMPNPSWDIQYLEDMLMT